LARRRKRTNLEAARERMYHDLVFECAERVFAARGFEAATMQEIAAEAGVSLSTVYAAFKGKNELYQEILVQRSRSFVESVADAADGSGTALERLERSIRSYARYLLEHAEYFQILLQEGRAWGVAPASEGRDRWAAGTQISTELVTRGIGEGIFYEQDPQLAAVSMQALMQAQLALLAQDPGATADSIADEICVQVCRLLCRPDLDTRRVA
jgi:AcrR family transcriptional regulator